MGECPLKIHLGPQPHIKNKAVPAGGGGRKCALFFCNQWSGFQGTLAPVLFPWKLHATAIDSKVFCADPPHRNLEPWLQLQSGQDWF